MSLNEKIIEIDKEKAGLFREKSKHMVPNCFGGYDKNDIICQNYCCRSNYIKLTKEASNIQRWLNETGTSSFFSFDFKYKKSCQQKNDVLKKDLRITQKNLKDANEQREARDLYCLPNIERITVGKKGFVRDFNKFVDRSALWIETKDTRFFSQPYGPGYPKAEGKVYQIVPASGAPGKSEIVLGFVKSIKPKLPGRENFHFKALKQIVTPEKNLVLIAEIKSDNDIPKKVKIELYGKSAQTTYLADDLGII